MTYRPYAAIIAEANANNSSLSLELKNGTASTIPALSPVGIDSSGDLKPIDVTDELSSLLQLGITESSINSNAYGKVIFTGRIENVTLSYPHGTILYVSKASTLTNQVPTIGINGFVAGDKVIRVGGIVKNKTNPSLKDLIVKFEVIGTL